MTVEKSEHILVTNTEAFLFLKGSHENEQKVVVAEKLVEPAHSIFVCVQFAHRHLQNKFQLKKMANQQTG